jgi:hypothetical protein
MIAYWILTFLNENVNFFGPALILVWYSVLYAVIYVSRVVIYHSIEMYLFVSRMRRSEFLPDI